MLTHSPDPIFVRASVSGDCNLNCIYCPKAEGMENRVPETLRGCRLNADDYISNLKHLARQGLRGVAFTGGEPTLNPDLPIIVKAASNIFERVELTTNGRFFVEMLPAIAPHLDILKVSLDAVELQKVKTITNGTSFESQRAITSIRAGCEAGLRVGINVVVMRSTVDQIDRIIDFCRMINLQGFSGEAYVSLLDFYYSEERRTTWEQEFLPLSELASAFSDKFGPCTSQERFGCQFFWFETNGVQIRFKDSIGATHRASKCRDCRRYCQEGIYGLKHSIEGWVTTCPTGDPKYGVHLQPMLSDKDVDLHLDSLLQDVRQARPDPQSFLTMLNVHALRPRAGVVKGDTLPFLMGSIETDKLKADGERSDE
jgi:molybdenum cofactor biosynthesis enzyme MoaA